MFFCEFSEISKTPFLIEHIWATASVKGTRYDLIIAGNDFLDIKP